MKQICADDTKVWHRIKKDTDSIALQDDLDRLQSWSDTWQLKFNAEKCKVMHIGHYFATNYYMGEGSTRKELESVQQEASAWQYTDPLPGDGIRAFWPGKRPLR